MNMAYFTLENIKFTYSGSCLQNKNLIEFEFFNDWRLRLHFENIANKTYVLNYVSLDYNLNYPELFPNAQHEGAFAESYDVDYLSASTGTSYKCSNGFSVDLGEVKLNLSNVHLQAFFNRPATSPFDTG
jgi:hypothetical protein